MQIFISYRRADCQDIAGRIDDRLRERYGRHAVFRDVANIRVGTEFPDELREAIEQSDIFLCLIGKDWSTGGQSSDRDFVLIEIRKALACRLKLVPILVHGASMPDARELPEDVRTLTDRHAEKIDSGADFDAHMDHLFETVEAQQGVHAKLDRQRDLIREARRAVQNLHGTDWDFSAATDGDRIVFLLMLQRFLAATAPLFELQTALARELIEGTQRRNESGKRRRLGLDDVIREVADQIPAERRWLRRRLRHETDNMRQVHGSLLRLLSRHRDFRTLVPSLPALYDHLSLWVAKYEFLREDDAMCLVFVGVEQGMRFPPGVESEIREALDALDERWEFSL